MFRRLRLRRAHGRFLESCRSLDKGRAYWSQTGSLSRWFLQLISPSPILGLHDEGQQLLNALEVLEERCTSEVIGEASIRRYHAILFSKGGEPPGEYRTYDVVMKDSKFVPPPFKRVPLLMKQIDLSLAEQQGRLDQMKPVDSSEVLRMGVDLYQRLGLIHPFGDGNGRVARLALNHLLRRYGLGYVVFPSLAEESGLWDALQEAHGGKPALLIALAKKCTYRV